MRKIQKKQIQEGIRQLLQNSKEIKKQVEEHDMIQARGSLEQCQHLAMRLGAMIEAAEGDDHAAVHALEMYCEQVYQIYMKVEESWKREDVEHAYQELYDILKQAGGAIQEIDEQRKVVFLPYKASMWDSLESIWLAASEDPDCIASVIPIPYYDRKADGSLGEIHYEGDLYPDDVPILDYRGYDLRQDHPDMIFIHNPYDDYNHVTSVHPFFYSTNLKRYTERLVYVPYFALEEISPDDQEAIAGIEHFCTVPGVICADRVIVQSEAMRRIYIDVMTRFMRGLGKVDWEKKILGLGSPKTDRIQRKEKEKLEIPEEWERYLQKPDGNRKKVVFYNLGLCTLPQYGERMLKKIQAALRLFRENREEIALLWRPHPLMQATLRSVDMNLWEAYHRIVEQYKKEGWGIYDDSTDVDRAVLLCDAYYGDGSSVVQLCKKAGKIILLQNVETVVPAQEQILSDALISENIYDDGDSFWFTGFSYNSLFRMDKKECIARLVGIFPDEGFIQHRPYISTSYCNGKLYFAPFSAKEIAEYDLEKKLFRKIPVDIPRKDTHRRWENEKFFKCIAVDEKVYFIPYHYPGILCYDTQTDTFTCFDDWIEKIEEIRAGEWGYFVSYEVSESRLILPCTCADAVVMFDMVTGTSQIIQTSSTDYTCKFCGISHVEDLFYLVSADGTVRKRKLETVEEEESLIHLPRTDDGEIEFYPMQYVDGWLYLFPLSKNKGIRIDTRTDCVDAETLFDEETGYEGDNFCFLTSVYDGKRSYAFTGNSRRFVEYDLAHGEKKEKQLFLSTEDRASLEMEKKRRFVRQAHKRYVIEDTIYSLNFMLDVLQTDGIWEKKRDDSSECSNGKRIYETLISE